jgi:hypothetical protein
MRLLGAICFIALSLGAPTASATGASDTADPGVEIVGGADARTVPLQVCPKATTAGSEPAHVCKGDIDRPYLGGRLTVKIRGTIGGVRTPKVSYAPANGTKTVPLPGGDSKEIFPIGEIEDPLKTRGGALLDISIGFAVPLGNAASSLDGTLLVSMEDRKPLAVPVSGKAREFDGVTVDPSTLPIDSSQESAELTLEGPELLEYLRSRGGEVLTATLYGDGGNTAKAEVRLPTVAEAKQADQSVENGVQSEYRAIGEVSLTEPNPAAGKYTGKLALPDLPTEARSVAVELHAHDCWPLLVLLVFVGVATTGFGARLVTTATRRKRLTEVLKQTHEPYTHVRGTGKWVCAWDLDDLLAEATAKSIKKVECHWKWPWRWNWKWPWKWRGPWDRSADASKEVRRLQGLPALRRSIETARSSKDLDEDAARVLDMVARMQRWLRVEPLARLLAVLAEDRRSEEALPADSGDPKSKPLSWTDSATARDTRALCEMARREPEDAKAADDLVSRLLFQTKWHSAMARLWDELADKHDPAQELRKLDGLLGDSSVVGTRKPTEQDALEGQLDHLWEKHLGDQQRPEFPETPGEHDCKFGITPVDWQASAHLFTGWATLDEPSYGQLERRAATSSRALFMPFPRDIKRELCLLNFYDGLGTAAVLLVASAAYSVTTYSDTWGGRQAFISAFLAGALGKVAIEWAALPIFQSIRLRKAKEG